MSKQILVAAVDLGAESGRVVLGKFDGKRLEMEAVHRFANSPVRINGTLYWNTVSLFEEILQGLNKARQAAYGAIAAVGVDTWGCDFGLFDANGALLGLPVHYRDKRTDGLIEEVTSIIPREEIFAQTGIAFWPFDSLYQLRAMVKAHDPKFSVAKSLLFMPDLLNYWLSGKQVCERSVASTTQCLLAEEDAWATDLLEKLDIPTNSLLPVVKSGTILGPVLPEVAAETGLDGMQVIATCGHDTAAAVVAAPLSSPNAAYLSCGTWSLLGIESDSPLTTPALLQAGFTNEKGVGESYRILKNIMGLWLVQQSRAAWTKGGEGYDYADLALMAEKAPAFQTWISPNDLRFLAPDNMVEAVQGYCRETGQPVPTEVAAIMRCLLESLAFAYRQAVDDLELLKGIQIPALHIIGGGGQNRVLAQWTANALGRTVTTGPTEGTAMGNMLVQLMALGEIADLAQARAVVVESSEIFTYDPQDADAWEAAYGRFRAVTG